VESDGRLTLETHRYGEARRIWLYQWYALGTEIGKMLAGHIENSECNLGEFA